MNASKFLENLTFRFLSGNDVSVGRTQLNDEEIQFLKLYADAPLIKKIEARGYVVLSEEVVLLRILINKKT